MKMNQAKSDENQQVQRRKMVKVKAASIEKRWKLGNLQLKIFHYLPNYLSPTSQA